MAATSPAVRVRITIPISHVGIAGANPRSRASGVSSEPSAAVLHRLTPCRNVTPSVHGQLVGRDPPLAHRGCRPASSRSCSCSAPLILGAGGTACRGLGRRLGGRAGIRIDADVPAGCFLRPGLVDLARQRQHRGTFVVGQASQRRADIGRRQHVVRRPGPPSTPRGTGCPAEPVRSRMTCSCACALRSCTSAAVIDGNADRQAADRADRALLHPLQDQRLVADEHVHALERQVRLDRRERRVRDLQPAQVRRALPHPSDHVDRDRVSAPSRRTRRGRTATGRTRSRPARSVA